MIGLLVFAGLYFLVPVPHDAGFPAHFVHHFAVIVLAVFVPIIVRSIWHRDILLAILDAIGEGPASRSKPLQLFLRRGVRNAVTRLEELQKFPGAPFESEEEVRLFARACFEYAQGTYYGVDSHGPSEYMKRYRGFLDEQAAAIRQTESPSARVLAVAQASLRDDYANHREIFRTFVDWHRDNGVFLLQVDPSQVEDCRASAGIPSADVGFWVGHHAACFQENGGSGVRVQFATKDDSVYREARAFVDLVASAAYEIRLDGGHLNFRQLSDSERQAIRDGIRC